MSEKYAIVLTTWSAGSDAEGFARTVVNERLAACVNVLPPMRSTYRWKGDVEQASEHQLVIKTTLSRVDALRTRLQQLHPYDVPEFLVLGVTGGSEQYLRWIGESVAIE